jgi:hypothetical protein
MDFLKINLNLYFIIIIYLIIDIHKHETKIQHQAAQVSANNINTAFRAKVQQRNGNDGSFSRCGAA